MEDEIMDIKINPQRIYGNWDEGWALDKHIERSEFIGYDGYNHQQFDTTRTGLGEACYQLKYKNGLVENLLPYIKLFLDKWDKIKEVDFVLPTPPSDKSRDSQPAFKIAKAVAKYLGIKYTEKILFKNSSIQSKNMTTEEKQQIVGSINTTKEAKYEHNILLVDDLYDSGATLNECVKILKDDPKIKKVYVLTMTKTRGY